MISIHEEKLRLLQKTIAYSFTDASLLEQALSHSSFTNEHRHLKRSHNERLEYLGDAVLELSSSDYLFHHYPEMTEGEMSKLRASLVCEPTLAMCARQIGLPDCLLLGKGEEHTGGRNRDSLISDALEALIGAIYLDGGFDQARAFVWRFVMNDIEHKQLFYDSKTILQEIVQRDFPGRELSYELIREEGPDHAKQFVVELQMKKHGASGDGTSLGQGSGSTKKGAEQDAAYHAILLLRQQGYTPGKPGKPRKG